MLLAYDGPSRSSGIFTINWSLDTSHGNVLVSPNFSNLTDGLPGTVTRFQINDTRTPAHLTLTASSIVPAIPVTGSNYVLMGVVNVTGTSIGAATASFTTNGGWATTKTQALTAGLGSTGYNHAWALLLPSDASGGSSTTQVVFDLSINVPIVGSFIDIGEIWYSPAQELPTYKFDTQLVDPTALHRSTGNQAWPVLRKPFRKSSVVLAPVPFAKAFTTGVGTSDPGANYQSLFARIATQYKLAIVDRYQQRGAGVVDTQMLQAMAYMARMVDPTPTLAGNASEDYFGASMFFEEIL